MPNKSQPEREMAFLKWNHKSESDSEGSDDIQALLEEMERSTYLADKRNASKDLIVSIQLDFHSLGSLSKESC